MKYLYILIKRIVIGICMLYTFDVLVSKTGLVIPINIFSISFTSIFGIPGIVGLAIFKKIIV